MEEAPYILEDTEDIVSPALVYYPEIIRDNTERIIRMAGGADRLWPHVKSHKSAGMIRMQIASGITRFKCATVAEAETAADAGALQVLLAYPLIGPNVSRYLRLARDRPGTVFYALGDDYDQLTLLSAEAKKRGLVMNTLIDVDVGMHRTGVALDRLEDFYERSAGLGGLALRGFHCYDGHIHDQDFAARKRRVEEIDGAVLRIRESLGRKGLAGDLLVMGGTPTFPCRAGKKEFYLSPGTAFIGDWSYYTGLPDLAFTPGAALFTRVVSRPAPNGFTLDLGYKGIAADPPGLRGLIAGMEEAEALFQSEEHWVFSLPPGREAPSPGAACYVIPSHICPTSALYPEILIAERGRITGRWQVDARNRKTGY